MKVKIWETQLVRERDSEWGRRAEPVSEEEQLLSGARRRAREKEEMGACERERCITHSKWSHAEPRCSAYSHRGDYFILSLAQSAKIVAYATLFVAV